MLTWNLSQLLVPHGPETPLHDQHPESLPTTENIAGTQQKPIELCFGMVGLLSLNSLHFSTLEFAFI